MKNQAEKQIILNDLETKFDELVRPAVINTASIDALQKVLIKKGLFTQQEIDDEFFNTLEARLNHF